MSARSIVVVKLQYREKRKRERKYLGVGKLPDGLDLLDFLHSVASASHGAFGSNDRKVYMAVDSVDRRERALVLTCSSGDYGWEREARHSETGSVTHTLAESETATVLTRVAVYVPKTGDVALIFFERTTGAKVRNRLTKAIERAWSARYENFTLDIETVVHGEAWLNAARLEQATAVVYGYESDIAGDSGGKVVGELSTTITPPRGDQFLPNAFKQALVNKKVKRATLFGFHDDAAEPDEIRVTVSDQGQSRTYTLGQERTPPVVLELSVAGAIIPGIEAFTTATNDEAMRLFEILAIEWHSAWSTNAAGDYELPEDLEVPSENIPHTDSEGSLPDTL